MLRNSTTAVIWDMDRVIADTNLIVDTLEIVTVNDLEGLLSPPQKNIAA